MLVQTLTNSSRVLTFSPDSKRLVTEGGYPKKVQLWSAESGTLVQTLAGCRLDYHNPNFSPDGKWLVTRRDGDRAVQLWSAESGMLVQTFAAHSEKCQAIFSPDGKRPATTGSRDATVCLWSLGVEKC